MIPVILSLIDILLIHSLPLCGLRGRWRSISLIWCWFEAVVQLQRLQVVEAIEEDLTRHVYLIDHYFLQLDSCDVGQKAHLRFVTSEMREKFVRETCTTFVEL